MNVVKCPKCGGSLPANSPEGLCPKCLLFAGLQSESPAQPGVTIDSPSHLFQPPSLENLAEHFPQLEILELIGRGGMGAVYKARHRELDRLVALKVLPPEVGGDAAFAERFGREARALAKLSHPNIVGVFDSGRAGDFYFFVMEYIDGVNLREAMQLGELSPEEALAIVPQICDALQYAHDEGVVHRDIKPENVLVDKKGRVKIADFGLSKLLGRQGVDYTLTQTQQIMGTPRYMAPEQMTASHAVDHRADIYSLGVVFYELLTGEVPMGRFEPPSQRVHVDVRLDEVVLRALEREPAKRYQAASAIKTAVETISTSKGAPVNHAEPPIANPVAPVVSQPFEPAESKPGATGQSESERALRELKIPAIGLMVVGILAMLGSPLFVAVPAVLVSMLTIRDSPSSTAMPHSMIDESSSGDMPAPEVFFPEGEGVSEGVSEYPPEIDLPPEEALPDRPTNLDAISPSAKLWKSELRPSRTLAQMESHHVEYEEPVHYSIGITALLFIGLVAICWIPFLLVGWLIFLGGRKMVKLQGFGMATTGAILAILPCQPVFLLGLVFGIWALVVLNRPHVKAAFAASES